jgi:DNA-binding MarR family transcriptional regulator
VGFRVLQAVGGSMLNPVAGAAITLGSGILMTLTAASPVAELAVLYAVFGIGFGFLNPPISHTAVSGMPPAQAGVAASIASTSRQAGSALGVAVTGSLVAGHDAAGFAVASHSGRAVLGGCGLAAALIGVASSGRWAAGSAPVTCSSPSQRKAPSMTASPPPPPDLPAEAWQLMRQFVEANSRNKGLRAQLNLGAGSGRVRVLFLLREQPMTLAQLADAHGVDRPYATIIVDKLEQLGFVERQPHPSDRRSKVVSLTPAGRAAADTAERILSEPPPALRALTTAQVTRLTELLAKLT